MPGRAMIGMLKEAFADWKEDGAPRLGAALSYYTIFSLAPLLVVTIAIAGFVFGREAAQGRIVEQVGGLVGPVAAEAIQTMLVNAEQKPMQGLLAAILGVVTLLLGATGVFMELKTALNTIWEAEPPPRRGIAGMLRERLASFTMVLVVGFLLLVSLVLSAGLAALTNSFSGFLGNAALLQVLDVVVSLAATTALFAMMFKLLPDVQPPVAWRDVWAGAVMTAVLFTIGKFGIGLYLGRGTVASPYGAAGSLVILLVWVYYAAQILFFGAELTQVYARRRGSRVGKPAPDDARSGTAIASEQLPGGREAPRRSGVEVHMSHVVETGGPRSLGQLLKEFASQISELVRKEVALAKTELSEKASHLLRGATAVSLAGGVLLLAGLALLQAVINGATVLLDLVVPASVALWLAPLLVALAFGAAGWLRLQKALKSMRGEGLAPRQTVETLQETKAWIATKAS